MPQDELVSIIVTAYNVEAFVGRCLESLMKQTYTNLEVIVVNDGSTDATPSICDDFAQRDYRLKVIHKKNAGVSQARNDGIDASSGRWLCFIDGDDYIHPYAIATLYSLVVGSSYKIGMIGYQKASSAFDTHTDSDNSLSYIGETSVKIIDRSTLIKDLFGISGDRIIYASVVWNKIYSKDLIEAIRFKDLYAIEDREFNLRAYLGVENVPYDPRKYYYYVQREESIVHNSATVHRRLYSTLEGLIEMYHELPASENMIRELLLGDIYRKMLSRHSILRKTSYFKCMKSLCDGFVKETGRNYLKCRSIPMKEKIAFAFFSKFPKMTDYYLATLNKG